MNTFQLDCFLAVSTHLNYARAAEELSMSQPAVTRQIQALEAELGTQLFFRSTREVSLTASGLSFLEDARRIAAISKAAIHRFHTQTPALAQEFTLACTDRLLMRRLPDALRGFQQQFPELKLRLAEPPPTQLMPKLREGLLQAVLSLKLDAHHSTGCSFTQVWESVPICVCSPSHPLAAAYKETSDAQGEMCSPARHAVLSLERLRSYPSILYDPASTTPPLRRLQLQLSSDRNPNELCHCESAEAACIMAEAGLGACVLPACWLPSGDSLLGIPIKNTSPIACGIYRKSGTEDVYVRTLARLLAASQ